MRKILFFIFIFPYIIGCLRGNKECSPPPPSLAVLIQKTRIDDFFDVKGKILPSVYFYKVIDGKEEKILFEYNAKQLFISKDIAKVYTGKYETIFLKNRGKTVEISVNGSIFDTKCGDAYQLNGPTYVDGVKSEKGIFIE